MSTLKGAVLVLAIIGSSVCGAGVVLNGKFTVSVASSATTPGCGTDGATVIFRVNGVVAEGSVIFSGGGNATVTLTVAGLPGVPPLPSPLPLPIPFPALPSLPGLPGPLQPRG